MFLVHTQREDKYAVGWSITQIQFLHMVKSDKIDSNMPSILISHT